MANPETFVLPIPDGNQAAADLNSVPYGSPPCYEEALVMGKPKPGDVVQFRNEVDGTICTFTYSAPGSDVLGDPPIYNFADDERRDVLVRRLINRAAARAARGENPTGNATAGVGNSTITVNVNTDANISSTITVNTDPGGNVSTITVNATSVTVDIAPESTIIQSTSGLPE